MGGSDPNRVGGAANAVCLTSQPVLKEVGGEGQFIGGAEYGSSAFGPTAMPTTTYPVLYVGDYSTVPYL